MRGRSTLLLTYFGLLLLSWLWRPLAPATPAALDEQRVLELTTVDGTSLGPNVVRQVHYQWGTLEPRPTLLLVHGSPGSGLDFASLGLRLGDRFRIIAPDLPGFGRSTTKVPDYSIAAHARYLEQMLDQLGVEAVHLVGFSMGGGVALHLAELAPARVQSLTLLSAIGAQELELLGDYHINHALHALQLGGLWAVHRGIPHFGALDGFPLDLPYARNFLDTDQRPLRGLLERFEPPMLIVHGEHDVLVPAAAAREHHRLVPQSELAMLDASHFMLFRDPDMLAERVGDFVARVEGGEPLGRESASENRKRLAAEPWESASAPRARGFTLVVWFVLLAFATMVSEDLTCIAAGLLVAQGRIAFLPAAAACTLGIFLGDLLLYSAGRFLGRPWLLRAPFKWWVSAEALDRSRRWFDQRGAWVIFLSRFIPGTRLPTYLTAGAVRMNAPLFTLSLLVPVAIWAPLLVAAARFFGERMIASFDAFSRHALVGSVGALVGLWLLLALARGLGTYRGRRRLVGAWHRFRHWEFWPPWLFYPPVLLYVLWLGLRYRSPALFTAANPGMPAGGGFIGESKSEILSRLGDEWVARYRSILPALSPAERVAEVRAFLSELGADFPVVLKPDVGQRGSGVGIVRSEAEAEAYFTATPASVLAQEYVAGPELGVFYVRLPGEERGRVFSVTDKRLPKVEGDGRSTVERLILEDRRAVAMASVYSKSLSSRLDEVPAEGEAVRLVEIGTHCRGAVFLDGAAYLTPRLEAAIERMSRSFKGFFFGRYDLRAPSYESFREGRDLKVLELNGVTSEATHIYDHGLFHAYRVLFEQWRLAFEIGGRNRAAGHRPLTLLETLALLRRASH